MSETTTNTSIFTPRLIFGLILIVVGALLTLDRADLLEWDTVAPFFLPSLLAFIGLVKLLPPATPGGKLGGSLLLIAAGWLLLYQLGYLRWLSFWKLWPLLLVAVGGWITWRAVTGRSGFSFARLEPRSSTATEPGSLGTVNAMAVLGSAKRSCNSADFRGGDLFAFMGGCEIDLREARIAHSPAVIDAFAWWGGIDIRVPEDWSVQLQGIPLLGGYDDSTRPPKAAGQVLIVKGVAIMGGVEIKN
jgi:hypothetical protein